MANSKARWHDAGRGRVEGGKQDWVVIGPNHTCAFTYLMSQKGFGRVARDMSLSLFSHVCSISPYTLEKLSIRP